MNKKRVEWIDIAKGITILLVIVSHTVCYESTMRWAIFSFHMPLFFLLSAITFRPSKNNDEFVSKCEKAFRHLIIPALGIFLTRTIIKLIQDASILTVMSKPEIRAYLANIINTFIFGSGAEVPIGSITIPAIGIPWFFIALFLGRSLYDYLHLKLSSGKLLITTIICTIAGVCISKIQWLPFSFDIVLAIQPFFYVGDKLKQIQIKKRTVLKFLATTAVWFVTFWFIFQKRKACLELAARKYEFFPLCYLSAFMGILSVSYVSQLLLKLKTATKPIMFLGKNSMIMLIVHCFDGWYMFAWKVTSNDYANTGLRILADIIVFSIVSLLLHLLKKRKKTRSTHVRVITEK